MFSGLECFKQVKRNFSSLCIYLVSAHKELNVWTGPNITVMTVAFFLNLKLYFYIEKISLTQKVLSSERKVQIKTSTSLEN